MSLLLTAFSTVATLAVRHHRLLADQRAYRLAVDDLGNRLARLTALPLAEAEAEHARLNETPPSGPLSGTVVRGAFERVNGDQRITLTLDWAGPIARRPRVTLVGWSHAVAPNAPTPPEPGS